MEEQDFLYYATLLCFWEESELSKVEQSNWIHIWWLFVLAGYIWDAERLSYAGYNQNLSILSYLVWAISNAIALVSKVQRRTSEKEVEKHINNQKDVA